MHSEDDETGRPGEWLPFGQGEDVWRHEAADEAYPPSRPDRARHWGMVGGIVFLGLVIAGGGGAFGADAYATHAICAAVGQAGPARSPDGAVRNSAVALDKARRTLDDTAALLFFHPELRTATHGLAGDLAAMRLLEGAGGPGEVSPGTTDRLMIVAASVDTHARQAQTACGLPAEGVLTAAAVRSTAAAPAPPAAVPAAPPATLHAIPTPPSSTRSRSVNTPPTPAHERSTPGAGAVSAAGEPDGTTTPAAVATRYTVPAGELRAAERTVAITARRDRQALVSPTASAAERQVASYEHAAAEQHLADLRAGTPNVDHRALDIRGAKARLAAADEAYRRAMVDPSASSLDRSQARAIVEQWDETLTRLEK